jgi:two-component system, cell cycle response regulator DivK
MRPKTVLLVEDNPDTREIYRTMLREHGYTVLEADNGEDGIALACERLPDIILMNISIPDVDGWTATTLLKRDPATASIPLIVVTAFQEAMNRERATQAGCDGYLDKPVGPNRVLAEVQRCIGPAIADPSGGD